MNTTPGRLLALAILGSSACSYQLVSPPARLVSIESARPVARNETVVGARTGAYSQLFDPGVALGTAGARHGIADGIEVNGEATYAHLIEDGHPGISRSLYTAHVGTKVGGRHLAATAGIGGGFAPAGGGFTALDVGGIVAYDNCYVVPFLSPSLLLSVPIGAKTVDFGEGLTSTAKTSYGFGAGAGIEIPLSRARCREGKTPARLQLGANMMFIHTTEGTLTTVRSDGTTHTTNGNHGGMGLALGVEFPL